MWQASRLAIESETYAARASPLRYNYEKLVCSWPYFSRSFVFYLPLLFFLFRVDSDELHSPRSYAARKRADIHDRAEIGEGPFVSSRFLGSFCIVRFPFQELRLFLFISWFLWLFFAVFGFLLQYYSFHAQLELGFIVSTHKLSCSTCPSPPSPPPASLLIKIRPPRS